MPQLDMKDVDLASKVLCITFTASVWSGKRKDDEITERVSRDANASRSVGIFNKMLIAKSQIHSEISGLVQDTRRTVKAQTLPWTHEGLFILPVKLWPDLERELKERENKFGRLVEQFIREYPNLVTQARVELGTAYRESDYPSPAELQDRFQFGWTVQPLPDGEDFRKSLSADQAKRMSASLEKKLKEQLAHSHRRLCERVLSILNPVVEAMDNPDKRFKVNIIENLKEIVAIMPDLNVTDDENIKEAHSKLADAIKKMNADEIRRDPELRKELAQNTKAQAAKIEEAMAGFMFMTKE